MKVTSFEDLTGQVIGPFVVLGRAERPGELKGVTPRWRVRCRRRKCGVLTERNGNRLREARAKADRPLVCFSCGSTGGGQ